MWTVGHWKPDGKWEPESDHGDSEAAAQRCAWLNGSMAGDVTIRAIELLEVAQSCIDVKLHSEEFERVGEFLMSIYRERVGRFEG